jgi:iron complex outermembrane recepter protein
LNLIPFRNGLINLSGKYVSRQYLDNTSNKTRSLDPYFVQDLRLSWQLPIPLFKSTELIAQVNNMLNNSYEANGYSFSYQLEGRQVAENFYFPMAGTNILVGLNITL